MIKSLFLVVCLSIGVTLVSQAQRKYLIGDYNVYVLTENEGVGSVGILVDAPAEVLASYAPEGTFPNAIHAVLMGKEGRWWLVDTGFGRNIFEQMAAVGVTPEEIDHVLLTHMHGDHIGGMLKDERPAFPNADVTVAQKEHAFWSSRQEMMARPADKRGNFDLAQSVLSQYGDKVRVVEPGHLGDEFADGIHMIEAYGHTPGHVMFLVKDGASELLIWGDLTHAMAVQMPHPEISVTYDADPAAARQTRIEVLKYVAAAGIPVAGMHVPSPGIGYVRKGAEGTGYEFSEYGR